ncbi:hypothetical protein BDZ91DRAFT_84144 [Kalaharituber pfeilii]|nr:hypothetical protein BDZ91DRAFT_84144 [Kalaharituber pfeilii]
MAQRSARARSKLEKISQSSASPLSAPQQQSASNITPGSNLGIGLPFPFGPHHNISNSTSFNPTTGLLTPSASSIATGSSGHSSTQHTHLGGGGAGGGRHGFAFYNKNGTAARKSALRAIFEGHSDKIRGRLEEALRKKSTQHGNSSNTGGGFTLGGSLKKHGDIREEKLLVKRWDVGGKAGVVGWDKLQRDPELWFSDGDTLVYLCPQGHPSHQYSRPSFRIRSSVLRETESQFFHAMLTDSIKNLSSAPPPRTQPPPRKGSSTLNLTSTNLSGGGNVNRPPPTPPEPGSPMSFSFDILDQLDKIPSRADSLKASSTGGASISPTVSNTPSTNGGIEGIKYEVYFPAPIGLNKEQTQKYHLTTRNVFALLFGKGLVGVTLGEALLDLVERLDIYIPPSTQPKLQHRASSNTLEGARKRKNRALDTDGMRGNVGRVLEYLLNREFDDLRNCPDVAAGVLCFAEKYQLSDLWREAFCHCVGMLNQMEGGKEYMEISPITKALIDRASLEIQVRTGFAESRLATFQYDDMWPTSSFSFSPSRIAFERFQKFLIKHYQFRFGAWPPPPQKDSNSTSGWGFGIGGGGGGAGAFSRQIYLQLQRDFAALYDYLVNKDVTWQYPEGAVATSPTGPGASTSTLGSLAPHGAGLKHKPKLVSLSKKHFRADDDNLPITDILSCFDNANGFPHIPYPYPLVPEVKGFLRQGSTATSGSQGFGTQKHGFLAKRNMGPSSSMSSSAATAAAAADKAAALALSESTNIHSLLFSKASNELVDAFARHEKEKSNGEFTPSEGRKGRWILIYGVLQTLATVVGDSPGLKYTEGVEYFLNSKLKGTPPWVSGIPSEEGPGGIDDHHTKSHCWTVVNSWNDTRWANLENQQAQMQQLTPVVSGASVKSAPPRTGSEMFGPQVNPTLRSIGVGAGDTTDTDAGYNVHHRVLGGRKRKAIPKTLSGDASELPSPSPRTARGRSMSGDEGDDEADEDDDVVMGEDKDRDVPLLEREVGLDEEISTSGGKGKERESEL